MIYILLCILMNVLIYVNFKLFGNFKINPVQAIIFNYFFCVLAGIFFAGSFNLSGQEGMEWIFIAIVLGVIFIVNFNLISQTTHHYGISVSSIATKLSLIIPVVVSLFLLRAQFKQFDYLNFAGIALALPAMVLGSIKKRERTISKVKKLGLALPFLTFFLSGTIDTTINITNFYFLEPATQSSFIIVIFLCAAIIGTGFLIYKREKIGIRNVIAGLTLGIPNYLALYFLIRSLSAFDNDGSLVYPSVNIGIIVLASIISWAFFQDRLSTQNKMGILLAIISIFLIYHQELLDFIMKI
jgi:uncharacterized membrane protein